MSLKSITAWDGEVEAIGVEDTEGGVWWPNEDAAEEIQAASDPKAKAIEICDTAPVRGEWQN